MVDPESVKRTHEVLTETLGDPDRDLYRLRVVPGYGDLDGWIGRNAWKDVYPFLREAADLVTRGSKYVFEEPADRFKAMADNGELLY